MGCREEFPHLQQTLDTFKDRGFTVLAINLEPTQRQAVLPLLAAMRIGFVPLESDWAWADEHYGVKGTPAAFLLDRQQRIVFRPEVHDAATRAVLDRQVEALLNRPQDR
jgi:AhpC/TSA family